jgi:single-strand DNA-binding protein
MSLPSMSGVGRCTEDPSLRFSQSGTAVCAVNLAFNSRRKNQHTQEWEDGDTFFVRATAFKELAESMAESLTRGCEVVVSGRLKTDSWEDKNSGEKRSATSLLIDAIGPSMRWATVKVNKADRGDHSPKASSAASQDDPWASAPPAGSGDFDETPPF